MDYGYGDCDSATTTLNKLSSISRELTMTLDSSRRSPTISDQEYEQTKLIGKIKCLCNDQFCEGPEDVFSSLISSDISYAEVNKAEKYKKRCKELAEKLREARKNGRENRRTQENIIQNISEILKLVETNYENYLKKIKKYENDRNEQKAELASAESRLQQLTEERDAKLAEITRLTRENLVHQEDLGHIYNTNRQLQAQYSQLQTEFSLLQKQTEDQISRQKREEDEETTIRRLREDITESYSNIDSLRNNYKLKSDQLDICARKRDEAEKLAGEYKLKLKDLVEQVHTLSHENDNLKLHKTECLRLRNLAGTLRRNYEKKLVKGEEERGLVAGKWEKAVKAAERREKLFLGEKNEFVRQIRALEEEVEHLGRENNANLTKIDNLTAKNEENVKKIKRAEKIEQSLKKTDSEVALLESELAICRSKSEKEGKIMEEYAEKIRSLSDKVGMEQGIRIEREQEVDQLKRREKLMIEKTRQLEQTVTEKSSTCERLERELFLVEKEFEESVTSREDELRRTREQLSEDKSERENLTSTVANLNKERENLQIRNAEYEQSQEEMSQQLDLSRQKTSHLHKILSVCQQRLASIEREMWSCQQERVVLARRDDELRGCLRGMEQQVAELEGALEEQRRNSRQLEAEKTAVEAELGFSREKLEAVKKNAREHLSALNRSRSELSDKLGTIRELTETVNSFRGDFLGHLRDINDTVSRQKKKSFEISLEIREMSQNIKARDARILSLEDRNKTLESDLEQSKLQAQRDKTGSETSLQSLERDLEKRRRQVETLSWSNRNLEAEKAELEAAVKSMNVKLRSVMKDFGKISHQFEETLRKKRSYEKILQKMKSDSGSRGVSRQGDWGGDLEERIDSYLEQFESETGSIA